MERVGPRNSAVLRAKMQLTERRLKAAFRGVWENERLAELFPALLVLLHQVVRASVPLMTTAGDAARDNATDPGRTVLADYLDEHIEEERDHDVWTLDDLAAGGWSAESVLARVPSPTVAAMVGAQYYWIEHHDPLAVLGYIAVLEGSPPGEEHIRRLQEKSGLPDTMFRTYRKHGELDPGHGKQLDALIDALPLSPSQSGLLGMSAAHTQDRFAEAIEAVIAGEGPLR